MNKLFTSKKISFINYLGILSDVFSLNIALGLSYYLRYFHFHDYISPYFKVFIIATNILWLSIALLGNLYSENRLNLSIFRFLYVFVLGLLLHLLLITFFFSILKEQYYTPTHLLLTYLFFLLTGSIWRILGLILIKKARGFGINQKKFVVVGYGELSSSIVEFYKKHLILGNQFLGYFDEQASTESDVKSLSSLEKLLVQGKIDYIYCCQPYLNPTKLQKLIQLSHLYEIEVKILVDFRGFLMKGLSIEFHDIIPILKVSQTPPNENYYFFKRIFDFTFAVFALILGAPIFLILAFITKFTSNGPVLFRQKRTGQWGKPFYIFKFRSMYVNADEIADKLLNGDKHSIGDHDPRITPWGRFMRKTRIDELPQFINVLIGDMSIVGPRPLADYDAEMLTQFASHSFQRILTVKPGLTSIGQLHYGYASTAEQNIQRMRYDLIYLDKLSFSLDLLLILRTIKLMTQAKGQ